MKISHVNFLQIVLALIVGLLISPVGLASASETHTIKGEELQAKAIEFLEANIPWDPNTTEIEIAYRGKDIEVPRGVVDMNFDFPAQRVRMGRFPVTVRITVDKILQKRLRMMARVTHFAPVVKTLRRINRGEILTSGDVVVEVVPSNRIVRNAMTSLNDVVGNQAIRNLGMGRVITTNSINKPTLVKKGDRVTLIAVSGAMKITAPGIVRQKGFKDSLVQVLNIQTQKTVFGMVQDATTVKVNF
jgi:flagella basal body P-ring formation protein FlgA